MYRNLTHPKSVRRGVGVAVLTGAAAGLISLAGAGSASASPDVAYVPSLPSNIADAVSLNPQPLPPRLDLSRVALNPQPLPPAPTGRGYCCHGWDSDECSRRVARAGRSPHVDSAATDSS